MNWLCAVWASGRLEAAGCGTANTAVCHARARAAAPVAFSDMFRVAGDSVGESWNCFYFLYDYTFFAGSS